MKPSPVLDPSKLPLQPGIYFNISTADYHALPLISRSLIVKWRELGVYGCPKKFKHWYDFGVSKKSNAFRLGTALDVMLLEPENFAANFIIEPCDALKRPTKAQLEAEKPSAKAIDSILFWRDFDEKAGGREVLSEEEAAEVRIWTKTLQSHPHIGPMLSACCKATVIALLDGLPVKAQFDLFSPDSEFLLDLKTTEDASAVEFARSSEKFDYKFQAAMYMDLAAAVGHRKEHFGFVCQEKAAPYCTNLLTVSEGSPEMLSGRMLYRKSLQSLAEHFRSDVWPDHTFGALKLSRWDLNEEI